MSSSSDLERRLDAATTDLLPRLRGTKELDAAALMDLLAVADDVVAQFGGEALVPRSLVGKLWFVFTAMLTEAEYAPSPDPILDAAWDYHERLIRTFGPSW